MVFFTSALAHEYLVNVPLGVTSYYAFLAMMMQAPVIILEKKLSKVLMLQNSELGNVSFWLFFCFLGQPTCLFIYYSLYMKAHMSEFLSWFRSINIFHISINIITAIWDNHQLKLSSIMDRIYNRVKFIPLKLCNLVISLDNQYLMLMLVNYLIIFTLFHLVEADQELPLIL